jgi:hypothetical protein
MQNHLWWLGKLFLPRQIECLGGYDARGILEAAGVKFLGAVQGAPEFLHVELPTGWKTVKFVATLPTSLQDVDFYIPDDGHFYHLLDANHRPRAEIADQVETESAGFDGDRFCMDVVARFSLGYDTVSTEWDNGRAVWEVLDCNKVIYFTLPIAVPKDVTIEQASQISHAAEARGIEWLNSHYPDWRNPGAYWD